MTDPQFSSGGQGDLPAAVAGGELRITHGPRSGGGTAAGSRRGRQLFAAWQALVYGQAAPSAPLRPALLLGPGSDLDGHFDDQLPGQPRVLELARGPMTAKAGRDHEGEPDGWVSPPDPPIVSCMIMGSSWR